MRERFLRTSRFLRNLATTVRRPDVIVFVMGEIFTPDDLRFFDRDDDYSVTWNRLPHWSQAGTVIFITWRTADSMPEGVLRKWTSDRDAMLREHGINPLGDWRSALDRLPRRNALRIKWQLIARFDERLDECHGAGLLKQIPLQDIVADSLLMFDGDRYIITDFCVMPNHIHLLAAFATEESAGKQISGWKRFQARMINSCINRSGSLWQARNFDHLVRSEPQFAWFRSYIADNGRKAGLSDGEYRHWSRNI